MKHKCPSLCPSERSNMLRNRGKFLNKREKLYKASKEEIVYDSRKFGNSLKSIENLIYTRETLTLDSTERSILLYTFWNCNSETLNPKTKPPRGKKQLRNRSTAPTCPLAPARQGLHAIKPERANQGPPWQPTGHCHGGRVHARGVRHWETPRGNRAGARRRPTSVRWLARTYPRVAKGWPRISEPSPTTRASAQARFGRRTSGHRSALGTSWPRPSPTLGAGLPRRAAYQRSDGWTDYLARERP